MPGPGDDLGQLKIGPDQQLYMAVYHRGVVQIKSPDNPSLWGQMNHMPYFFNNPPTRYGLPSTIPDFCEPKVNPQVSKKRFCVGEDIYVWANPSNAAENLTYTWNVGQTSDIFLDNPQQTTNYAVTLTDHYGCSATGMTTAHANGFLPVADFHFEDATGVTKTVFQCGEDIFLNGLASSNESDHWLDLWEVDASGNVSYITGGGWKGGPVNSIYNLSNLFGMAFQPGKTYQVKLAVKNPPCSWWESKVLNFTVATPMGDPNFTIGFIGQSGTPTAQINLNANTNALPLEHFWSVTNASGQIVYSSIFWFSTLTAPTISLPPGEYTIFHAVRNKACGVYETSTQELTIIWQESFNKGGKLVMVEHNGKKANLDFGVYPNPTTDQINISTEETIEEALILDLNGKVIKSIKGLSAPVNDLAAGVYIVQLKTVDKVGHKRFIKQ